eukprot:9848549-Alexandrium_andersonii.AAC.1
MQGALQAVPSRSKRKRSCKARKKLQARRHARRASSMQGALQACKARKKLLEARSERAQSALKARSRRA